MTMNPLPPQAYTRDTLTQAYEWLQSQPAHIKELASNTEILVSLFLKVKMNGNASLERPSIQNFKTELKNLAGMIGEFEKPKPKIEPKVKPEAEIKLEKNQTEPHHLMDALNLDAKSIACLREVQELYNLSTETEALRLLISVGYKKVIAL